MSKAGKELKKRGVCSISTAELSNFASVENITAMLVAALLVQLSKNTDPNGNSGYMA